MHRHGLRRQPTGYLFGSDVISRQEAGFCDAGTVPFIHQNDDYMGVLTF